MEYNKLKTEVRINHLGLVSILVYRDFKVKNTGTKRNCNYCVFENSKELGDTVDAYFENEIELPITEFVETMESVSNKYQIGILNHEAYYNQR